MLRSSISLGRWMGVEVRLHLLFPLLLVASAAWGAASTGNAWRGAGLFAALLLAIAVRETARILLTAYAGLQLRAIFLLPIGGVLAFAPGRTMSQGAARALTVLAPLANFSAGAVMLGVCYAAAPGVHLLTPPWISTAYVLRSFVWTQFLIGVLNLLPTTAMPTRQLRTGGGSAKSAGSPGIMGSATAGGLSLLAFAMVAAGLVLMNVWLIGLGVAALLIGQLQSGGAAAAVEGGDGMQVRDVMLTDCVLLSTSDTLRGALDRTVHSLQDVFPVVRGDRLVGSVARATLADHLQVEGDGFLQGVMTKNLQVAGPTETLVLALRRAAAQGASEFIPVVENGRMLGILTPQSLGRAVQQVKGTRAVEEGRGAR